MGKLDVLNVECDKCGRRGRYRLDRLVECYGLDAKLFEWEPEADCPREAFREPVRPLDSLGGHRIVEIGMIEEQRWACGRLAW